MKEGPSVCRKSGTKTKDAPGGSAVENRQDIISLGETEKGEQMKGTRKRWDGIKARRGDDVEGRDNLRS